MTMNATLQEEQDRFWATKIWYQPCQHCYCLDDPGSTDRPLPHKRCCKCGDVRVAEAAITW